MKFCTLILCLIAFSARAHADCNEDGRPWRFDAAYTADVLANVAGGLQERSAYLDNLDLTASMDGDKTVGLRGTCLFAYALYNNGTHFSDRIVGDAQVVSNIETGVSAVRLYEAWAERRFAEGRVSLRGGLYDLNAEFDVVDIAGVFLNSAQGIGTDFGQTGLNGPSIFPATSLALRGEVMVTGEWLVRGAILDAVPGDPQHPARTTVKLGDGALVVGEANYAVPTLRIGAGFWRYSETFADMRSGAMRHGNAGWYALAETPASAGPGFFAHVGHASEAFNEFGWCIGAGVVYTGLFADGDVAGVAVAWARAGDAHRSVVGGEASEVDFELTWQLPLSEHVIVQPDVQYVVNPGLDPTLRNALVLGIRLVLQVGG